MKKRRFLSRVARRVLTETPLKHTPLTGLARVLPGDGPDRSQAPPPPRSERIEYGDGTDIVATDELGVLTGMVGLRLGLEPRGLPLLVNHWATWCDGCVGELSDLVALRKRTQGRLDFVAVGWEGFSGGGEPQDWVARVDEVSRRHGVDWSTMVFEGGPETLFEGLGLTFHQIPQTRLISPDGECLLTVDGVLRAEDLERIVEITGES